MQRFLILFSLCLIPAVSASTDAPKDAARAAAEKGLTFLANEGVGWKQKRNCISCHHGWAMLWSLNEAKRRGYSVDDKALTEVTDWVNAVDDRAKGVPAPPMPKEANGAKIVRLVTLTTVLGMEAAQAKDGPTAQSIDRYLTALRQDQRPDGSWGSLAGGRLPLAADPELMTTWSLLALTGRGEMDPASKEAADKGLEWLKSNSNATDLQTTAMRLLLLHRLGRPREELKPLIKDLLSRQNADGGWAQAEEHGRDAYGTGQTLYVLKAVDADIPKDALRRAQAWLVNAQKPDGSWAIVPRQKPGDKPYNDAGPISYVGTAWATMALVRTLPQVRR
jgi:squalene-hopene/tetraprenyl-beta-curcumene cyclase